MTLKRFYWPVLLACCTPLATTAQSISPSQIEQFQSLPQAQQEALARQYGVDLDSLTSRAGQQRAMEEPSEPTVRPVDANSKSEKRTSSDAEIAEAEEDAAAKNNGLKPFGYDLFAGRPTTFAPVTEIPVPTDYILGPGDVLQVQLWGKENQQLELPVSRDGTINFPQSGPQSVAGLSFDEARKQLQKLVSETYIGVQASIGLGELRSMRVFVLGDARSPGSYTVSSLSTITNALFVSGGVKPSGSLRRIQHKRDGKLVGELDLYELLLNGDTSGDARLQPGDVIFIPSVGARVGIEGEIYRPALYELKSPINLQSLISLAGGFTPQAYPQLTRIERVNKEFLRTIAEADLTTRNGKQATVQPGDRVNVASISDITGQYIEIKGAATRPGRYAWVPGMRVSSVIPSLNTDLLHTADKQYAAIVRTNPDTDNVSVINLRLRNALENPGSPSDTVLEERDELLIFSDAGKVRGQSRSSGQGENQNSSRVSVRRQDPQTSTGQDNSESIEFTREKLFAPVLRRLKAQAEPGSPEQTVRVSGPVRYPGEYPLPASRKVRDAIFVAGGLTDSASLLTAELARYQINDDGVGETRILQLDLTQVLEGVEQVTLRSRDRLLIKSIPDFAKTRTVKLSGEVRYPGEYTFRGGETLSEVIVRAGGLTRNAFPQGAVFTREKLRQLEAQRLREAEERLQGDLLGVRLEGGSFGGQKAAQVQEVEGLLEDVQSSRPVGRMVIDLSAALNDESYQPIMLQNGDALTVPMIPQSVSVFGEVQFPTSHLHSKGLTVDEYLDRSGGPTRQADESRVYVVKANGSVMLPEQSKWFGGRSQQLAPGDTIIVPIDVDRLNQLELWSNVSQIVYQMALGAAAVGNL
ncbi:SLBB domain-containing protein [Marinobacter caseinilyticus]|uniref:SLBB domain-containing protein n=1 Tax=Marinobacter caseinilyticus TaxID=2692195 RepID=UPI001F1BBAA7|nr:SLBB domain-containing protein [Marinobacter caseinilyticus]